MKQRKRQKDIQHETIVRQGWEAIISLFWSELEMQKSSVFLDYKYVTALCYIAFLMFFAAANQNLSC